MPRRLLPVLLLLACLPAPARAWTWGDTLTVIMKPLPNIPSFARPGDTLTVWANAPVSATSFSASLLLGSEARPLAPAGGGWEPTLLRWVLRYQVPAATPSELFDLILLSDSTLPDTSRHSVRVLSDYKSDFYFAQISDTHLPTHALSSGGVINTADSSAMNDFNAVIDDLNLIHPEFILHTGDLVNEGELEDYLGMFEMGRAMRMLQRLRDPIFIVSGNHDQGGWKATAPPDGTARKNWWRQFGWSFLGNPPPGDPNHSQNYSFDYGLFHGIGLEAYINNGSYDSYMTNIWGAQSFTAEQLAWLNADIALVPAGHSKLVFYHYDFGGTNANGTPGANFSQINPALLGLDGAIWGHNHGVAEGAPNARPFNLGLQAVIDGRRAFRIFRVSNGVISPGFMHKSAGGPGVIDSLTTAWSSANDGTRSMLTATVNNRFKETWDHARLVFAMADHDSSFRATGGSIAQVLRRDGVATVYVDFVATQNAITSVSVIADQPLQLGVASTPMSGLWMVPYPVPMTRAVRPLTISFSIPARSAARLAVFDISGRRVASLLDEARLSPGGHEVRWNGLSDQGAELPAGLYLLRLEAATGTLTRRITLLP